MDDKIAKLIVKIHAIYEELEKFGPRYSECLDSIAELADRIEEISNE